MTKKKISRAFIISLLFSMTLIYGIGWCADPNDEIRYLESMQRELPDHYVTAIKQIIDTSLDPYVRERGVLALTDIALNRNEPDDVSAYLKELAMGDKNENVRTAAYASIHLIRDLRPQPKKGALELFISGKLIKGSSVALIARISSTVLTGEEAVVGITSLHENIELLSEAVQKRYLRRVGMPYEVQFDLRLNETGTYFIPVTFLLSFDKVDYEQIQKRIYVEVSDGVDDCLDDENPDYADGDVDGDVDGSDLSEFTAGLGSSGQECYDVEWFAGLFGMNSSDGETEPDMSEYEAARFMAVNPGLMSLICPPGCECLTGPDADAKFGVGNFNACSHKVCGYGWVGDLYMTKYCYSEIPIDECIDTDGGKNYDVKGSAPGCEDRCSEFSHPPTVVNECYVDVVDGKCQVNIAYYDCDSVCEDGRCLPPTCDDWIQNQGEDGIDCSNSTPGAPGLCDEPCICPDGCKCATGMEAEDHFGPNNFMACSSNPCGEEWIGDFPVFKYCYKKIESSDCYDTDGGADIYEKGSAPGCVDTCTSDQTLQECLAFPIIDGCDVYSSPWECEGSCQDGACMMPSCDDGIQNQDEVSVDCSLKSIYADCDSCCSNGIQDYDEEGVDCGGSQCMPCGYIEIRGRLLYEDSDSDTGLFKPVRHGNMLVRFCDSHPCTSPTHQAQWPTDSLGNFIFWVPKMNFKSVFVRLGHVDDYDPYWFNYAVRIAKDLDDCHELVWWHSGSREIPPSRIVNFGDLKIGRNTNMDFQGYWAEEIDAVTCGGGSDESGTFTGGSEYFNIADAILYARQYAEGKRSDNDNIGYVDVQWPDAAGSQYNPMYEELYIEAADGFSDYTIIHEYGHYLQDAIGTNDEYWGDSGHNFCTDDKNEEFAWSEGFAEYFGTIVPSTYAALSIANSYIDRSESPYCFENLGGESCCDTATGNESEATVCGVLWDIADTNTDENFDQINGRETLIFNIFDLEMDNGDSGAADAPDLREFIEQGINCRLNDLEKGAVWNILDHFNVTYGTGCN